MKYLQVNQDKLITDCIDYAYGDYVEFDGEVPQAVSGGWHKLENGVIVEYLELKPKTESDMITELESKVATPQEAIDFLLMGGM